MSLEIKIRKCRSVSLVNRREGEYLCHNIWRATSRFYKGMAILFSDTTALKNNVEVVEYFITVIMPPKLSSI